MVRVPHLSWYHMTITCQSLSHDCHMTIYMISLLCLSSKTSPERITEFSCGMWPHLSWSLSNSLQLEGLVGYVVERGSESATLGEPVIPLVTDSFGNSKNKAFDVL